MLKKYGMLILLILFFCNPSYSKQKEYYIKCKIDNYKDYKNAYLYNYYWGKYNLIDTAKVINGEFEFRLATDSPVGVYKIRISPDKVIENIIFNNEDIELTADYKNLTETLEFQKSQENKIYLLYNNYLNREKNRDKALNYLLTFYQEEDTFYKNIQDEFKKIRENNRLVINQLMNDNKNLIVTKLIKYEQLPYPENDSTLSIIQFLYEHFWDNFDFNDTLLLYSPILDSKINDYFTLYENASLSRDEQEENFKIPADKLLKITQNNDKIFNFIVEKILNDSETFGLLNLYQYVADKILSDITCVDESQIQEIQNKSIKLSHLTVGNTAIDFEITKEIKLSDIKSDFTLLIFWDSQCPHCFKTLSELKSFYNEAKKRNFEIVGVSNDTSSVELKKAIIERGYKWFNVCDFKGWQSTLFKKYNILATPTMFLLDKNKKIISRPINAKQVIDKIKKAG
ncbi:DUF5106 domain-containing protein [Bacteroidetes/Chlorobi group bacterium ChocPot_Mid]|nr:MAG: DUF5106 domain-containing protein [Bacteroidetes/Chlorobi group bacterium ChocPot_Mid]